MFEYLLGEDISFRQSGLTDNIGQKLVLSTDVYFVLIDCCQEGIYFSFGHPVGEEYHQGWLKDEGLPIAQEGLSLSEYPEVADSV